VSLGGSAVFDIRATEGEDWPHVLEHILKSRGYENLEVINGGVPGHASPDALGRLYSQVWMWEPDFVLLYSAWNDVKYFHGISPDSPLISMIQPYSDEKDPLQSYLGPLDRLLCSSQIYVKLRTRYFLWKHQIGAEGAVKEGNLESAYSEWGGRQYKLILETFVDACRNSGSIPVLLTEASLVSSDNSDEDRSRISYVYQHLTHDALVRALSECNEIVRRVAREKKVKLVDLAKGLNGRRDLFDDHVHTNRLGSRAIAETVARSLAKWLQPSAQGYDRKSN